MLAIIDPLWNPLPTSPPRAPAGVTPATMPPPSPRTLIAAAAAILAASLIAWLVPTDRGRPRLADPLLRSGLVVIRRGSRTCHSPGRSVRRS
jgi:hypothetical protein